MNDLSFNSLEIDILSTSDSDNDSDSDSDEYTYSPVRARPISPIRTREPQYVRALPLGRSRYRNQIPFDHKRKKRYFTIIMGLTIIGFYFISAAASGRSIDSMNPHDTNFFLFFVSAWPKCNDTRLQLWRFISSGFVHANFVHIFFNMLNFYFISNYLEIYYHHLVLLNLFLLTRISTCFFVYFSSPYVVYIGCSDGIFGLLGSLLSHSILNYKELDRFELTTIVVVSFFVLGLDIVWYFIESSIVAHFAHWNEMINGFLLGLITYKAIVPKSITKHIRVISAIFFICLNAMYINNYCYWPPQYGYNLGHFSPSCCQQWFKFEEENRDRLIYPQKNEVCQI